MKKLILSTLCVAAMSIGALAQGTFNFGNGPSTLFTLNNGFGVITTNSGAAGTFRFELFRAAAGTATDAGFVSTGIIGTNLASAGRLNGGNGLAMPGTALGGTVAILVRGWSANLGSTYAQALANYEANVGGWLGSSAIAPNFLLGGDGGSGAVPNSPLFAGASGIQTGFSLVYAPIPEPSSMALAGLGAAALMIFRRRK